MIALASILIPLAWAQVSRRKISKGPRAIGLLQLSPNGTARLIPVAMMIDGNFYDAEAYKATPVPMALESGTVYEAISTGVSQGLFTVSTALQANNNWTGVGTYQPAGIAPPKKTPPKPKRPDEDTDEPPKLRRSGTQAGSKPPAEQAPAQDKSSEPAAGGNASETESRGTTPVASDQPATSTSNEPAPPPEDPNRPVLRRGKSQPSSQESEKLGASTAKPMPVSQPAKEAAALKSIPAISDANVQEFRSFEYKMKPEEEEGFRKKMLAMAADEVNARLKTLSGTSVATSASRTPRGKSASKPAPPAFDDVSLRVFDLTSSNEPVLVLMATAHPKGTTGSPDMPFFVTLVSHDDIYGELHKAFSNVTDPNHLDVLPRMEVIDCVDADGDGVGELLFRRFSDNGSAYSIYRVIGNQLFALFEGKL